MILWGEELFFVHLGLCSFGAQWKIPAYQNCRLLIGLCPDRNFQRFCCSPAAHTLIVILNGSWGSQKIENVMTLFTENQSSWGFASNGIMARVIGQSIVATNLTVGVDSLEQCDGSMTRVRNAMNIFLVTKIDSRE